MWSARSRTGWTVIWASGLPHQIADLLGGHRPRCLLHPGQPARAEDRGVFEVDVQHHLTLAARGAGCRFSVSEVEGGLVAGQVADRDRAAYVQGLGGAGEELLVGVVGDRGLQVQGIGEVEVPVDPDPAGDTRRRPGRCRSARPRPPRAVRPPGLRGRTWPWLPRSAGPAGPRRSCAPRARRGRRRTPPPRVRDRWCVRRWTPASRPAAARPPAGPSSCTAGNGPRRRGRGSGARRRWTCPARRRTPSPRTPRPPGSLRHPSADRTRASHRAARPATPWSASTPTAPRP